MPGLLVKLRKHLRVPPDVLLLGANFAYLNVDNKTNKSRTIGQKVSSLDMLYWPQDNLFQCDKLLLYAGTTWS